MSKINLEEILKLARNTLLEFDKRDFIKENSTVEKKLIEEGIDKKDIKENSTVEKKLIEEDTESRKIVVLRDISLEEYRHLHGERKRLNVHIRLIKGEVIAYEMPSPPHAAAAGFLAGLVASWSEHLSVLSELDLIVDSNSEYCVDFAVEPIQDPPPLECSSLLHPRMIVEVGKTETINSLHGLARGYFSDSAQTNLVQVYLSIKIFPRRSNGTAAMIAMLYINDLIPDLVISFGTAPLHHEPASYIFRTGIAADRVIGYLGSNDVMCTAAGMSDYQVDIPSSLLFVDFPGGVPQGTPNHFTIDLWKVQRQILYRLPTF